MKNSTREIRMRLGLSDYFMSESTYIVQCRMYQGNDDGNGNDKKSKHYPLWTMKEQLSIEQRTVNSTRIRLKCYLLHFTQTAVFEFL